MDAAVIRDKMEGNQRGYSYLSQADSGSLDAAGSRPGRKSIFSLALCCLGHLHPIITTQVPL